MDDKSFVVSVKVVVRHTSTPEEAKEVVGQMYERYILQTYEPHDVEMYYGAVEPYAEEVTDEELAAIRARYERARDAERTGDLEWSKNSDHFGVTDLWSEDVPTLLAEVERLRTERGV